MASMFRPFQEALGELVAKPLGMASDMISRIRLDVDEDDMAYTVRAEIPGAHKEDIQVSVDGNRVALSAEVRRETHGDAGQRTLYAERSYGSVSRSFLLPGEVDPESAAAQYRDGVLNLVLPKKSALSGHRVPIS